MRGNRNQIANTHWIMEKQGNSSKTSTSGIKIAGRNISNLRYADNTTLMTESEEELKNLLMKMRRRVKKLA